MDLMDNMETRMQVDGNKNTKNHFTSVEELDFRKLYEGSPLLQRTINKDGTIINCNQAYAKHLGYTKEEVIGKIIFDHTAEKSLNAMRKSFHTWKKTGTITNREIWFKRKDRTIFPVLLSATNIYDKNDMLIGSNTVITDITEIYNSRKKIEASKIRIKNQYEELKRSNLVRIMTEQRYRDLYENTPALLRSVTIDGIIADCNQAYAKHLGYTKEEVIGKSIFDHTAEKSIESLKNELIQWKKTQMISSNEIWMKRKDGTIFPTLLNGTSLYGGDGKVTGRTAVLTDLTQIYLARAKIEAREKQIEQQLKDLKKLSLVKDEFLAMITHELKTPLVPIRGFSDIMLSEYLGPLNEKQKERLLVVRSSTDMLLELISDILDSQKIELGQLHLSKQVYNLSEIINETITQMNPKLDLNDITITTDLKPMNCLCDKTRITQVISNLISNALDFCPKQNGHIHIKSYPYDIYAKIVIQDNGIGISEDNLEKIFVKFYQIDTKSTREHRGSGLGLSVCKGIVEAHGGKIWAESKGKNKGAEIHLLLPVS
ncbi:MAG: PAS domain-containing sensor histidine kinase [Thaumarchaeota archaeon]|nr:PAS domain-containing sensor histidine kinase [Nitrososphaerota archaeon]